MPEKIVTYKNGARAVRQPNGQMRIISGPTIATHRGKNKKKTNKQGKGVGLTGIIGGPNTIPPWTRMGIPYSEWIASVNKNKDKMKEQWERIANIYKRN